MRTYASEDNHRWAGFEHRPGDIVVSTRSKCGTTLTQLMCALLVFGEPELPAPLGEISPWLDWSVEPLDVVTARLAAQTHRRIVKTHTPLDGLPLQADVTYVVVGRHPLDVAVSLFHHSRNIDRRRHAELSGEPEAARADRPFGEWIRSWIDPGVPVDEQLDTLPGLVHHVADARARRDTVDVVMLHFDDLVTDPLGSLLGLGARLGIDVPDERATALAAATGFDAVRDRAEWFAPDRLGVLRDATAFFRSGRSGEGPTAVDPAARAAYDDRMATLASPDLAAWLEGRGPGRGL